MSEPNPDDAPEPSTPAEEPRSPAEEAYDPYQPPAPPGAGAEPAQGPEFLQRPAPALGVGCGGCAGYFVLAQIVPAVLVGLVLAFAGGGVQNLQARLIEFLWVVTGLGVLVSVGMVALSRKLGWLDAGPAGPDAPWKVFAWSLGAAIACPLGAQAISLFQTEVLQVQMQEQPIIVEAAKTAGLGFWLAIVVGAPLGEELFFRRWFYGITRKPLGVWFAFLASGLAFAIVHGNFSAFAAYLWIAGCCTLAYERSGSIWGAIFVHFVNNAIAAFMLSQA